MRVARGLSRSSPLATKISRRTKASQSQKVPRGIEASAEKRGVFATKACNDHRDFGKWMTYSGASLLGVGGGKILSEVVTFVVVSSSNKIRAIL